MGFIGVELAVFLFLGVGAIALFSFLGVAAWTDNRCKERAAYYRSETLKKIAETSGSGSQIALDFLREQEAIHARRRIEGLRLGGLITAAAGIGVMVLLLGIAREEPVYLSGLIPLLIGGVLFVYAQFLAPKS